jgi:hypothetical protein
MRRSSLPSPRSIVICTFMAHKATKLPVGTLVQALRAELPELDDRLDLAQRALEELYTEGLLGGEGRGPDHIAALKLSLSAAAPLAA